MGSLAIPQEEPAPCSSDPDLWLSDGRRSQERAKQRCLAECAAATREWCLRQALDRGDRRGVYGGTTPADREALKEGTAA